MFQLFAPRALLPDGWARDVLMEVDADGTLATVRPNAEAGAAERVAGPAMPGFPNVHSHAFQRAMAGLAEHGTGPDSFWTWREVMYRFVARLTPEDVEAIAAQLYLEMLKAGYTAVGEFHYLHHDTDGRPYADPAEMASRVLTAARTAGIGLTLLPVLYGYGGFGGVSIGPGQRRFRTSPEEVLRIVELVRGRIAADPQVTVGLAPHSLRAVTPESLTTALAGLDALDANAPIYMHVAEQTREVADCEAWCGKRPVAYLLAGGAELGPRWCLIHATHTTAEELQGLARSGAVVGLCPTTEANLGDGVFPARTYLDAGGRIAIGSDSHVSVDPVEELRWLEYGQRLVSGHRNVLAHADAGGSVGATLVRAALADGAQALGRPIGRIAPGCRADLVILDERRPTLAETPDALRLDALVFAGNACLVRDVMVGGRWVVRDGRHEVEDMIFDRYRATMRKLLEGGE